MNCFRGDTGAFFDRIAPGNVAHVLVASTTIASVIG